VGEIDAPRLLVLLVHREIDDPGEGEAAFVDEAQLAPDLVARAARDALEFLRLAGHEEHRVALVQVQLATDRLGPFGADVLGQRPRAFQRAALALAPEDIAHPRQPLPLRPGIHPVAELARAAARAGIARTSVPSCSRIFAKMAKPEPAKCSDTTCIFTGLRRSGLSVPYQSAASR
jgi:hypothetical protein